MMIWPIIIPCLKLSQVLYTVCAAMPHYENINIDSTLSPCDAPYDSL